MRIILGSLSKRRKEILSSFSLPFLQATPPFDEKRVPYKGDPKAYCMLLAEKKALSLQETFPHDLIIAADTVVVCNARLYNKPLDRKEAFETLSFLSGKTHEVFSGVTVLCKQEIRTSCEITQVEFNLLSEKMINNFLNNESYLERSGSYTIQGKGSLLVKKIVGSYDNVTGLPVNTLAYLLSHFGIDLWDYL